MSEESREHFSIPPTHRAQNEGITPPIGQKIKDAVIDKQVSRRTVLGSGLGLAALTAAGLAAKFGFRDAPAQNTEPQNVAPITPEAEEKLRNEIVFLQKNEEGQLTYSDVAQYYDASFDASVTSGNESGVIRVRNEPTVNSQKTVELTANEMNRDGQAAFGVIRVASESDNHRDTAFNDYFYDDNNKLIYEWFALVQKTNDEAKPFVYVDAHGHTSEQPWFISPNFVNLDVDSADLIKPQ